MEPIIKSNYLEIFEQLPDRPQTIDEGHGLLNVGIMQTVGSQLSNV